MFIDGDFVSMLHNFFGIILIAILVGGEEGIECSQCSSHILPSDQSGGQGEGGEA